MTKKDCGCQSAQASARRTIDNGATTAAATIIQNTIYSALGIAAPAAAPGSPVEYRNGTFVQTTRGTEPPVPNTDAPNADAPNADASNNGSSQEKP